MFDSHYDLLTYIYMKYKENNLEFIKDYCKKIYSPSNIAGGIVNLFFMSEKEMKDELNINENELNVTDMLETVANIIDRYSLLPNRKNFLFGIEGCDYITSPKELEKLYSLGVRSINLVWNNPNKYASGPRGSYGLTKLGEELIKKASSLGIMIDLSHANEETFWDIIKYIKQLKNEGFNPFVFASHSNCRGLFEKQSKLYTEDEFLLKSNVFYNRNLSDEQLLAIKKLGGLVGIVSYKPLCLLTLDNSTVYGESYQRLYNYALKDQFIYLKNLFGDVNNIITASDDMGYEKHLDPLFYSNCNYFDYENIAILQSDFLKSIGFSTIEISKIMKENFEEKILSLY